MTDDSYIYEKDKIYFRKKYKNKKSEIIFRGSLTKNEIVGIWKNKDIVGSFELYLTGHYPKVNFIERIYMFQDSKRPFSIEN